MELVFLLNSSFAFMLGRKINITADSSNISSVNEGYCQHYNHGAAESLSEEPKEYNIVLVRGQCT